MSTSKEFRRKAWVRVTADWKGYLMAFWLPMLALGVVYGIGVKLFSALPGAVAALLLFLFMLAYCAASCLVSAGQLKFCQRSHEEQGSLSDVTWAFQNRQLLIVLSSIRVAVQTWLWSLLFVVPGILKGFSYSMSSMIVVDEDIECENTKDVLLTSMGMMAGNRMRLFKLMLSFIGWMLLGCVTFGLAYLFVYPYMVAAVTEFYYEVRNAYFEK